MALTLNNKISKIPMLATTVLTGLMLNTFSPPAQAGTINYPEYNGRRIHACATNVDCDNQGHWYVAHNYCNLIGYRRATGWETKIGRRKWHKKAAIVLEFRPSGNIWRNLKSRHYFKRIDCSY